jgi:hypothetical protein
VRTPDSEVFIFVATILSACIYCAFSTGLPLTVSNTVLILPELSLIIKESVVASIFLSLIRIPVAKSFCSIVSTSQEGALSPLTMPTEYILNFPFKEFNPKPLLLSHILP